ncbi:reverse transcriptase [Elysia marginata]|uniref:Reverse transcriptase n=1 Tax=Elysia marginata TaxID=1093978 RepID=A0AAV4JR21_9GAST|nr:reverse transcriptase [Elysia marginata]
MGFTNKHLDKKYPIKEWIRIYTDGSATDAVRNGGGGVYATLPDGTSLERSFACGRRCTNYKAETGAIKEALDMVNNKISKTSKVVILSDARSVLQTLENTKDTELDTVRKKLLDLMARFIIPGTVIVLSALIQHKAAYILSSILSLLAVLALGIFAVVGGIVMIGFIEAHNDITNACSDTSFGCHCDFGSQERTLIFKNCSYLEEILNLCISVVFCIVFSWIMLLVASVMTIYYSCRSNQIQTGVVYTQLEEQGFPAVQQNIVQAAPPQPMFSPVGDSQPYTINPAGGM